MEPASLSSLALSKSLLPDADVVGSMDRGCSLTKLVYKKPIPDNDDKVSIEMAFFANKDFEAALEWLSLKLKSEACPGKKFRVTGVGGEKFKDLVIAATGMVVEFVDEFVSQTSGAQLLVKNLEDSEFCYPDQSPNMDELPEMPPWIQNILDKAKAYYSENQGKRMPAVFCFCGSATGYNLLNEDDSLQVLGASMFGGKSMMSLAQLLVNTNSYDELMELAAKGDRGNVDTQAKDVMAQGEGTEYRSLPPDTPLFPLGKAADGLDASAFSREDLAAATVGTVIGQMVPLVTAYCKLHRVPNVYLGGHLFRSQTARDIFHSFLKMNFGAMGIFKFNFLSNGHTGCLGAMIVSPEEAQMKKMNIKYE